MGAPQVIKTQFPTEDVVIASVVAAAPADGTADATGALQAAIDAAAAAGGGVVFVPAGRYRLGGRLLLKEGVTLRGDWLSPAKSGGKVQGTILMPTADRGQPDAPPAISMERGSGIREVSIWYPDQKPDAIAPYPWTLRTDLKALGDNTTVKNVTLVNSYQGIKIGPEWNELHTIRNVYGTPLKMGISIDTTTDIGRLIDVSFSPEWWRKSGLPGAPTVGDARDFIAAQGVGVDMGRSDWEYLYHVQVEGYGVGLKIRPGAQGATNAVMFACDLTGCGTALLLEQLNEVGLAVTGCRLMGRQAAIHAPASFRTEAQFNTCELEGGGPSIVLLEGPGTLTFQNCSFYGADGTAVDARQGKVSLLGCSFAKAPRVRLGAGVARARILGCRSDAKLDVANEAPGADVQVSGYDFHFARPDTSLYPAPPDPRPASARLFVVTDFGAGPKEADNTAAFTKALDAARQARGGTVYVPAGNYRFAGEITVPSGVELRGSFDVPHHTISGGSVLMCTAGRGKEDGTPFIQLEPGSGVRGLTVWYPEQDLRQIVPYPWAIRSLGPRCWVMDVTLGLAYQGVDFWTYPSDGHLIRYVAGALLKRGVFVSKCKGDGWVEDVMFNPHYGARIPASLPHPAYPSDPFGGLIDYQRANLEGIVFGRCEREHVRGTFLYASYEGIAFRDDGGGANARVIEHGTDASSKCAVIDATGPKGVEFIDAQLVPLGAREVGAILTGEQFAGKVSFFNTQVWAGNATGIIAGKGDVLLQEMNTVSGSIRILGGKCALENANFVRNLAPNVRVEAGAEAKLVGNLGQAGFRVENLAGEKAWLRANALPLPFRATPGKATFQSGFEEGDPLGPVDTVQQRGGGMKSVSKGECRPVDGPAHTGKRALRVAGNADDPAYSYCYFKAFDGPLAVNSDSMLSYWIRPSNARGRCVGIDLLFTDGSTLRDSSCQTTDGQGVHPGGEKGTVGQWTKISIPIGQAHAGKQIAAILFAYDSRGGGGPFEALIDDVSLESAGAPATAAAAAAPRGGRVPAGTKVALSAAGAAAIRYTLDGTLPGPASPKYEKPILLDKPGLWEIRFAAEDAEGRRASKVGAELYEVK